MKCSYIKVDSVGRCAVTDVRCLLFSYQKIYYDLTKPKRNHQKSKSRSTRKKRKKLETKQRYTNIDSTAFTKLIGPILLSFLIGFGIYIYRGKVLSNIYFVNCYKTEPGDFAPQLIYNAINLQHQIKENKNKKNELLKLLDDEVVWFRRSRKRVPKKKIRTYSIYDNFCFAEAPVFDVKDDFRQNYELRFIGFHRFRNIDSLYLTVEKYYCKVDSGKINEVYPIPMNSLERESYENMNFWYKYLFFISFSISLVVIILIRVVINLPQWAILWLKELLKKYLPI